MGFNIHFITNITIITLQFGFVEVMGKQKGEGRD